MRSSALRYQTLNRVRLHLEIPSNHEQDSIFLQLSSDFNLDINLTSSVVSENESDHSDCDLEMRGTPQQIDRGLKYLKSLDIRMRGKPNATEDDWY